MTPTALPPIPHLAGRREALALLGCTGAAAEWLVLVCLHSGVFTRAQYCHRFDVGPWGAHRFVRRLVEARVAAERNDVARPPSLHRSQAPESGIPRLKSMSRLPGPA